MTNDDDEHAIMDKAYVQMNRLSMMENAFRFQIKLLTWVVSAGMVVGSIVAMFSAFMLIGLLSGTGTMDREVVGVTCLIAMMFVVALASIGLPAILNVSRQLVQVGMAQADLEVGMARAEKDRELISGTKVSS